MNRLTRRSLDVLRRAAVPLSLYLAASSFAPTVYAQSATSLGNVYCYDEARESVRVTRAEHCTGRVVSAAEAERIQSARDARTRRIVGERSPADGADAAPRIGRRGS